MKVKLGPKAHFFFDATTGTKVVPSTVVEIKKESERVKVALKSGHLVKVDDDTPVGRIEVKAPEKVEKAPEKVEKAPEKVEKAPDVLAAEANAKAEVEAAAAEAKKNADIAASLAVIKSFANDKDAIKKISKALTKAQITLVAESFEIEVEKGDTEADIIAVILEDLPNH